MTFIFIIFLLDVIDVIFSIKLVKFEIVWLIEIALFWDGGNTIRATLPNLLSDAPISKIFQYRIIVSHITSPFPIFFLKDLIISFSPLQDRSRRAASAYHHAAVCSHRHEPSTDTAADPSTHKPRWHPRLKAVSGGQLATFAHGACMQLPVAERLMPPSAMARTCRRQLQGASRRPPVARGLPSCHCVV